MKRARGNSKRSLKSPIKGLIAEEIYKESSDAQAKEGFLFKSAPRSVDMTQTKNEASGGESDIFSAANIGSLEKIDFLDIFKIDKESFVRNLQVSGERVTRFSHNGLASNEKLKLSKSRSFPDLNFSQRLKFKPSKLADKQKETWSFPEGEKLQAVSRELKLARSDEKDEDSLMKGGIQQRNEWNRSSLNESLDKYARLFENSYGTEALLNLSRSLRLTNENGHASIYSQRTRSCSLSNADPFYSNLNLGVAGDDAFRNDSFVIEKDYSFHQDVAEHEEKVVTLVASDSEKEPLNFIEILKCKTESVDDIQRMDHDSCLNLNSIDESSKKKEDFEARKPTSVDFICVPESINGSDPSSIPDSYAISQEKSSGSEQLKISEDKFVKSVGHAMDSGYVRLILDQSGIAKDASERAWHASDQPLSPQILEDVEACWPHEHDQLTSWQDFCSSCWQHQMLFDLVNETLVETYDVSLPYYPKPLSSSCHVRSFPAGNHIVEEVSMSIGKLLNLRTDEKQSLDRIMVRELKADYRWMNLQFESECIGLELEDMILDDLVEELVCF